MDPGDPSGEATPVPIPNTEVKLSSAEDTQGVAPRENRSSPGSLPIKATIGPAAKLRARGLFDSGGWHSSALAAAAPVHDETAGGHLADPRAAARAGLAALHVDLQELALFDLQAGRDQRVQLIDRPAQHLA